jgi:hypothetical protein
MSTILRTLSGDSLEIYLRHYCQISHQKHGTVSKDDSVFRDWLASHLVARSEASSETNPRKATLSDNLTQLAPDWHRRLKQGQVRMKTFLRIYLSKWFWFGLEWNEVEFVHILLDRISDVNLQWISDNRDLLNTRTGVHVFAEETLIDEKRSIYNKGVNLVEMNDLLSYIYTYQDYKAVWKLSSVQSLRDHIFVRVTGHEHEGKLGVRKNRIRGYRDGKASPRDLRRTALSREVDRIFYEDQFEERWRQLEEEISRYSSS